MNTEDMQKWKDKESKRKHDNYIKRRDAKRAEKERLEKHRLE